MSSVSFSGLASGIDSEALIKATLDARRLANRPLEAQIESNEKESKGLEEFNTKLLALNDSLKDFLTLAGNGISKSGTSSDGDTLGVSVSNAAPVSTTNVTVEALAKSATLSFGARYSAVDSPVAPAISGTETLTVTVGSGSDAKEIKVDVTSTTTLRELADKIAEMSEGKVSASVINVGTDESPQYAMVLATSDTGLLKGSLGLSVSAGLNGVLSDYSLDQAQNSRFTIAGIGEVSRSTNKISGIIPGVTFELKQVSPIPVQINVTDDRDKTKERFKKVVGLFNELVTFSKEKSQIERLDNGQNSYGDLARTRVDEQAIQGIKQALSDAISANGTTARSFADLGLATERDGSLKLDEDKFSSQLADDNIGASELLTKLADMLSASGGVIDGFTRYQGVVDLAITSNSSENTTMQAKIDRLEDILVKQEQSLKLLFANLESRISKLNSSSDAIAGMIAGTSSPK